MTKVMMVVISDQDNLDDDDLDIDDNGDDTDDRVFSLTGMSSKLNTKTESMMSMKRLKAGGQSTWMLQIIAFTYQQYQRPTHHPQVTTMTTSSDGGDRFVSSRGNKTMHGR
jgi:hypothetical protein